MSFEFLEHEMSRASERIYSEQMSIQYAWTDTTTASPLSWAFDASEGGVDVKIIADVTFADADGWGRDNYTVVSLLGDLGMESRTISGGEDFGLTHNKGVIIDDSVWISSINWTNAAFMNNREFAVVIYSKEVADFFTYYFLTDWGPEVYVDIVVEIKGNTAGEAVVLDASSSVYPKGTSFEWDLGINGNIRKGIRIAAILPEGDNECLLIATLPSGETYVHGFIVTIYAKEDQDMIIRPYVKYAPLIAIMLIILAAALVRRNRGNKDDDKGV
jgi:hypothetical protein